MAFVGYGLWPLLAFGGFLLLVCMAFCLYLYRLRRISYREQGFKLTRYGAFAVFSTQQLCPICLEDFKLGEKIAHSHCSHSFHIKCLVLWLKMHYTCPMCKKNLKPEPRPSRPPIPTNV